MGRDGRRGQKQPISGSSHILGSVSIFNRRLFLKTEIVAKQISFYIAANSDTFMLSRPVKPEAQCCVDRCYATLITTIISFSPNCFNETEGVNNKEAQGFTFPVPCFLFPAPFMIIAVLTLVNRSVIITGQLSIGADNSLSNCKHMKSSQAIQIAL